MGNFTPFFRKQLKSQLLPPYKTQSSTPQGIFLHSAFCGSSTRIYLFTEKLLCNIPYILEWGAIGFWSLSRNSWIEVCLMGVNLLHHGVHQSTDGRNLFQLVAEFWDSTLICNNLLAFGHDKMFQAQLPALYLDQPFLQATRLSSVIRLLNFAKPGSVNWYLTVVIICSSLTL